MYRSVLHARYWTCAAEPRNFLTVASHPAAWRTTCISTNLHNAHGPQTKSAMGTLTSSRVARSLMRTAPVAHSLGASSTSRAAPQRSACCSTTQSIGLGYQTR